MKRLYTLIAMSVGIALLVSSCSKDDEDEGPQSQATVTLLTTPNGLGDNGYNDQAAHGFFDFCQATGVRHRLLLPENAIQAEEMYVKWLKDNAETDSAVLILGSSEYEQMARVHPATLKGKGSRVLLFETNREVPGIHTVCVNHYGVSYLCGAMVQDNNAFILAATRGVPSLEDAIQGFSDGYKAHVQEGHTLEVKYLYEGEVSFAMPDSAFRLVSERIERDLFSFEAIFPLLGGSTIGAIKAVNYSQFYCGFIIGMDVNQNQMSGLIPFSMLVYIDKVLKNYLSDWFYGKEWPSTQSLGLREGATDIIINENYKRGLPEGFPWLDPQEYYNLYTQYRKEAERKEAEYER